MTELTARGVPKRVPMAFRLKPEASKALRREAKKRKLSQTATLELAIARLVKRAGR